MNILEQTEALKDLPDQALVQEMQMPTGMAAPIFITAELKRRKRMRDDYARREAQDMPTVAEEVVMAAGMPQGGIADAARAMAPKSSIAQNTGMADMMPRAATQAPQRMASGGIVRMAKGGRTQVEYDGRGYFVFADGDVQDALGRPVSDELAQAVKASLETPPERQEGTASLGSEILADASPQAPSLESVLSSDRPFSSLPPAVTDTRPAAPSDYGLGGERPSTLTAATQPAINQQQILLDAMSPAFDTFGGEPLARAEARSNLSGPSLSDISPTVPALSEMEKARLATEFTQQQELARAIRDQQEADVSPTVDLDLTGGGTNEKDLDAFLESQIMSGGRPGGSLPVDVLSQPVTDDTYRMPDVTRPETTSFATEPEGMADDAARRRAISELGLSPISSGGTEYLINDAGNMFKVAGGKLVGVSGGEAMQAIDVAQKQGADFTKSPLFTIPIGRRTGVDPNTGLVDPDSPYVPASLDISGLETPDFVDQAFKDGNLSLGNILSRSVETLPIPQSEEQDTAQPTQLTPTAFATEPEGIDSKLSQGIASDFTLGTAGDTASNALSFGDVSKLVSDDAGGGGGGGGGIVPTGGAATGLEARIAQMLSDREADRETDKYMALAQAGLALMASKNPTLGGAIGEAGLAGVGALRKAKSQYDADILGLMGLEEKARSSRLSRAAALAKTNRPKAMTGTERVGLLREAGDLREELIKLKADIAREGTLGDFGQVTPFTPEQLAEKAAQARLLESEINKYKGMAYPQLANVQTVNP